MSRKKGLGKGLNVLLGSPKEETFAVLDANAQELPIEQLQPGKYQPRTSLQEGALKELAASIRAQGVIQPIIVRALQGDGYEIIAGERRFQAARIAGLKKVPVWVKNVSDQEAAAMALIENIQREDLNPIEEAKGLQLLVLDFGFTHEDLARMVGRSRSTISNTLRLLKLAEPVQNMLLEGRLDPGHVRPLLALDEDVQTKIAAKIAARQLTARAAEEWVTKLLARQQRNALKKGQRVEKNPDWLKIEVGLSSLLSEKVKISSKSDRLRLTIDFDNPENVQKLVDLLEMANH